MNIKRFFITKDDVVGDCVYLRNQEFLHAKKVLRQKVGYVISATIGDGYDLTAIIEEIGDDFIRAKITDKIKNERESERQITLFQCIAKENDFIVQKAVEMGVTRFVPVKSAFVNAVFNKQKAEKIAIQAAKQCERATLMAISEPISIEDALACSGEFDCALMPYENCRGVSISDYLSVDNAKIALLVGCEGGFSEQEAEKALTANWKQVSLGKRILRAETAVIVALALSWDALGENK